MLSASTQMAATTAHATMAMKEMVLTVQVSCMHIRIYCIQCCDFVMVHLFGFQLSTDINECERDLDNCALNAACMDTIGNFSCTCNIGYSGDGVSCGKCSLPLSTAQQ